MSLLTSYRKENKKTDSLFDFTKMKRSIKIF